MNFNGPMFGRGIALQLDPGTPVGKVQRCIELDVEGAFAATLILGDPTHVVVGEISIQPRGIWFRVHIMGADISETDRDEWHDVIYRVEAIINDSVDIQREAERRVREVMGEIFVYRSRMPPQRAPKVGLVCGCRECPRPKCVIHEDCESVPELGRECWEREHRQ